MFLPIHEEDIDQTRAVAVLTLSSRCMPWSKQYMHRIHSIQYIYFNCFCGGSSLVGQDFHQRHILRDRRCGTTVCKLAGRWGSEKVYGEEKYLVLGWLEQPRQDKNLLYWQDEPIRQTKDGLLLRTFHITLISKLFCTKGFLGGAVGLIPPPPPGGMVWWKGLYGWGRASTYSLMLGEGLRERAST